MRLRRSVGTFEIVLIILASTFMTGIAYAQTTSPPAGGWTVLTHGAVGDLATYDDIIELWMGDAAAHIASMDPEHTIIHTFDVDTFAPTDNELNSSPSADPFDITSQQHHHVLLFEWTRTADIVEDKDIIADDGYSYAAGDALFSLLKHWGAANNITLLLGHSRGSVVVSETARRLALDDTPPHQVIFLDGEGGDIWSGGYSDDEFTAWAFPTPNGSQIRYDNIYTTVHEGLGCYPPSGNYGGHEKPNCNNYDLGLRYRHGACDNFTLPGGLPAPPPIWEYIETMTWNGAGYAMADAGTAPTEDTDDPNTMWNGSDGDDHADDRYLFHGNFNWDSYAGWTNHGGGGTGVYTTAVFHDEVMDLGDDHDTRTHSWFWMHDDYDFCEFEYRVQDPDIWASNDFLSVQFENAHDTFTVYATGTQWYTGWETLPLTVPAGFRNTLCRVTFAINPGDDGEIQSSIQIDNIKFTSSPSVVTGAPNIVLTIDRSGSMSDGFYEPGLFYLQDARNAAINFVEHLQQGDKVGVVSFAGGTTLEFPLTEILGYPTIQDAQTAIGGIGIPIWDGTSIGAGLQHSQSVLDSSGDPGSPWAIVILSDGDENTAPYAPSVLPSIPVQTDVYTISLGSYTNEPLMNQIASSTDGQFFVSPSPAQLLEIYNMIRGQITGEQTVASWSSTIEQGDTEILENVLIDAGTSSAVFAVSWTGSDIDLVLVAPDGTVVDPSFAAGEPSVTHVSAPTNEYYSIAYPAPGAWTMQMYGADIPPGGEPFTASVQAVTYLEMDLVFVNDEHSVCEPIHLMASLYEAGNPITDATVVADVEIPGLLITDDAQDDIAAAEIAGRPVEPGSVDLIHTRADGGSIELFDDGAHQDGEAGDGVYGGYYNDTSLVGSYSFHVTATGTSPHTGAFMRQGLATTIVVAGSAAAPNADFLTDSSVGAAPLIVAFTDLSTGCINEWNWNFGDGGISADQNPTHTYTSAGEYTASLTVTGPGGIDTHQALITVMNAGCLWTDATTGPLGDTVDGHGVSWGDFDGDGDEDLFLANNGANRLLRNDGDGVYVKLDVGLGGNGDSRIGCWGDYDGDGDPDLYVVNGDGPNFLYRNDDGVFADVTDGPLGDSQTNTSGSWADWDLDGDIDLYLTADDGRSKLLRNDDGVFVEMVGDPASFEGWSRGCAWGDYDNDGDPDLYVTVKDGPNRLFRNDRGAGFVDVSAPPVDDPGSGKGCAWGDYDNNGRLDLYVVNKDGANKLFRNDEGGFVDMTDAVTGDVGDGRTCVWGDYDNDGWLDLFLTNVDGNNRLFQNLHDGSFADSTCGDLATAELTAWGAAFADDDLDGDLDLYVSNHTWEGVPNRMFRNGLYGGRWLAVKLAGVTSNRDGLGARIELTADGETQMRQVAPTGYLAQAPTTCHFGVGDAAEVVVTVTWPSGIVQEFPVYDLNRVIEVVETASTDVLIQQQPLTFRIANHPNPFNPSTTISFTLPEAAEVRLRIFDVSGRLVRTLIDGEPRGVGGHHDVWNGRADNGSSAPSGLYFYRIVAGEHRATQRMTLVK